ncbi:hypothetical protein BH11MYX3_BH11MYX3_29720 [soil metagenome]
MARAIAVAFVIACTATAAAETPVMVFPLSAGKLPAALGKAPAKLTTALARSIDAQVANVPIEDAAGLLDCDPEATSCLEAVSKSVKAKRIVFGSMRTDEDGVVKVTVTRFDPGPDRQQRTFDLVSTTADSMAEELARVAAPLFGTRATAVSEKPEDPIAKPEDPIHVDEPSAPHGTISSTTWGIVGGGVLVTGVGVGFLLSASGIADQVRAFPEPKTPTDFSRLNALEDKGQTRQRIGIVLTAVGGVGLAYGVYRLVTERSARPTESTAMRITPVPLDDGAALVLTMGWP